jgi:hypothetical protein
MFSYLYINFEFVFLNLCCKNLAQVTQFFFLICRTNSFKTVESSLRVDALASAGFKISRTKLASLIRYELWGVNCQHQKNILLS